MALVPEDCVGGVVHITRPELSLWQKLPALSEQLHGCSLFFSAGWSQTGPRGCHLVRHPQMSAGLQREKAGNIRSITLFLYFLLWPGNLIP